MAAIPARVQSRPETLILEGLILSGGAAIGRVRLKLS